MPAKTQNQKSQIQTELPTEGGTSEMRRAQGARTVVAESANGRIQIVKRVANGREFYDTQVRYYMINARYPDANRAIEVIKKNHELDVEAHKLAQQYAKENNVFVAVTRFIKKKPLKVLYAPSGVPLISADNIPASALVVELQTMKEAGTLDVGNADSEQ